MNMHAQEETMISDLSKSGLVPKDIKARELDAMERTACAVTGGVGGYVIPYYDMQGAPVPFYRVKLFQEDPKYKQVRNTPNHVYFPPDFMKTLRDSSRKYICIVEGEKKAAALQKIGFAAIAFGGVDSWRNRSIILPKETEFSKFNYNTEVIKANIPAGQEAFDLNMSSYATGFEEFVQYCISQKYGVIIIYDSDSLYGVKPTVQRAAATLGYELRHRGLSMAQIKQMILPVFGSMEKMGVDDFLQHVQGGPIEFDKLFRHVVNSPRNFPKHPNVREYIGKKLQQTKISRKDMQNIAMSLVSELDTKGYRMHSTDEGRMYYFDHDTGRLMLVALNNVNNAQLQETSFGRLLYQEYGVSTAADKRLVDWLGAMFVGEEPVIEVNPHRVLARPLAGEDCVRFQISDGNYITISAEGTHIASNGDDGVLFEAGRVTPIDIKTFQAELTKQRAQQSIPCWWKSVLSETRLKDKHENLDLVALLHYVSPWLYRWRNTQLPVELVIGEPGSGKSSLEELRLMIQTGEAALKNAPGDLKDWHAALSNSGGLHVTDNVQLLNKTLRTMLSDEICRLITESEPHIEMRKYYTTADQMRIKVNNVFVFTAVSQPFMASDLLQRALVIEFDKSQDKNLSYDSSWKERKLYQHGGREAWLAHHCIVLERFFQAVKEFWDPRYQAKHRLINFEQILLIMASKVFNLDANVLRRKLTDDVKKSVTANDLTLQGLLSFAISRRTSAKEFASTDIANWALGEEDYKENQLLISARKLGIYMQTHKHMIRQTTGIFEVGKRMNKSMYMIDQNVMKALIEESKAEYERSRAEIAAREAADE